MKDPVALAFSIATLLGAACSLLLLPRYRRRLDILREAGQISQAQASRNLHFFNILIGLWTLLGVVALLRFFRSGSP